MTDISIATFSHTEGDNGAQVSIVFSDGTAETVTDQHSNFVTIVQALITKPAGYAATVYDLVNVAKTVSRKFKNLSPRVTTDGSELFFDGDPIDNSLGKFILKLLREDAQKAADFFSGKADGVEEDESQTTWEALVKFLELLYANPNKASQESLYEFISRYGLTIRKDGHFIAYKGLRDDFSSVNRGYGIVDGVEMTGALPNNPGSILRFPRKDVDSNTRVGCAQGLHAGTHAYASNWSHGKLVAVAINPTNVVSVPDDSYFQKIRVCEYEVLHEVDPLESAAATSGWDSSSSYWGTSEWKDEYTTVDADAQDFIGKLSEGDVVSFEYLSLNGNAQTIEDARIAELDFDQFKAFVPEKDGYRSFKHKGVSEINFADPKDEDPIEGDYPEDDDFGGPLYDYEEDAGLAEAEAAEAAEAEDDEETPAQSGTAFFDKIAETLRNGGGAKAADVLKGFEDFSEDLEKKAKERFPNFDPTMVASATEIDAAKKLFKESKAEGIAQLKEFFGRATGSVPKDEDGFEDSSFDSGKLNYSEGDKVSFDYTDLAGKKQRVIDAEVEEIQAEYFKAFVPAKGGFRTFKFAGVAAIPQEPKLAQPQAGSAHREAFAGLKLNDKVSVELLQNGQTVSFENATVLINNGTSVTVKLNPSGYKVFTADDVVKLSKN